MLDLRAKVAAEISDSNELLMEASPANEHESNGAIEWAVQTVGGMFRTRKLAFELAYGKDIGAGHAVVPWLSMHAAALVSIYEVGSDGRATSERSRGKKCRRELRIFGECVYYLPLGRAMGEGEHDGVGLDLLRIVHARDLP